MGNFFEGLGRSGPAIMNFNNQLQQAIQGARQGEQQAILFSQKMKEIKDKEKQNNMFLPVEALDLYFQDNPQTGEVMKKSMTDAGLMKNINGVNVFRYGDLAHFKQAMSTNSEFVDASVKAMLGDANMRYMSLLQKRGKIKDPAQAQALNEQIAKAAEELNAAIEAQNLPKLMIERERARMRGMTPTSDMKNAAAMGMSLDEYMGQYKPTRDVGRWVRSRNPEDPTKWDWENTETRERRPGAPPPSGLAQDRPESGGFTEKQIMDLLQDQAEYDPRETQRLRNLYLKARQEGKSRDDAYRSVMTQGAEASPRMSEINSQYPTDKAIKTAWKNKAITPEEAVEALRLFHGYE